MKKMTSWHVGVAAERMPLRYLPDLDMMYPFSMAQTNRNMI